MSDLISIGSSAVATYQRALSVVSNNIANASTEGYTRKDINLEAGPVQAYGTVFLGSGVVFGSVKRQYDAFVESNLRNSNSDLQSQKPVVDYTNRIVDVMGSETSGLGGALDQFFSSARALAADPASTVLRSSFLQDADGLASRFNQLSSQLDLVDSETRDAASSDVTQINALSKQLAAVNLQLSRFRELSRQPGDLLDQRDKLLQDLSKFAKVNTQFAENGEVTVSLGVSINKEVIVSGKNATFLAVDFNAASPEKFSLVLDPYGNPQPLTGITSGDLAGLITFREQVLSSTRGALDSLAKTLASEINKIHTMGIDANGQRGGELFTFDSTQAHAAGGLRMALNDPLKVCAAASFRVLEDPQNAGTEDATVRYDAPNYTAAPALNAVLSNNSNTAAASTLVVPGASTAAALATVPAGMKDVSIYLDTLAPGQQLQLLTRDGRHLAGQALTDQQRTSLLSTQSGFEDGAGYSTAYLNQTPDNGYRQIDVSYGARADARAIQQFDVNGHAIAPKLEPAILEGGRIATGLSGPVSGQYTLNGTALGALSVPAGKTIQASDVAQWLNNAQASANVPVADRVSATVSNEIHLTVSQLRLKESLSLNGVAIPSSSDGFSSAQNLVDAINSKTSDSGVRAYFSDQGEMVLTNAADKAGQDIAVSGLTSTTPNALGLQGGTYGGQVTLARARGDTRNIALSIGNGGDAATLTQLGFRTQVHIAGEVPDDMLVFVTGSGEAHVAASYSGQPSDAIDNLRATPMTLKFTAQDPLTGLYHFTITDKTTGTVLAERDYDPQADQGRISYQGLSVQFTKAPKVGDTFTIDGNADGTGDNLAMLDILDLQDQPVVNGKTLNAAYIDHVNDMGNVARQASIVQSSLKVVHDQALSSHDQISGVSLDEEATNLIRFQQAYQASAKVLEVASQLFDVILNVK